MLPEVAPDWKSEGGYALELGDEAAVAEHCEHVAARAAAWLPGSDACGRLAKRPRRAIYRVKTFQCILEIDNALRGESGDGPGLKHFQRQMLQDGSVDLKAPLMWPRLCISSDQGPDIWSALSWLEGPGRINVHRASDPSHGVHGDTLLAAWDCGLGTSPQRKSGPSHLLQLRVIVISLGVRSTFLFL